MQEGCIREHRWLKVLGPSTRTSVQQKPECCCLFYQQVDDLLYSKGLSLVGSKAISLVAIDHEGWALYPLGDEAQEEQADGEAPLQTAAVFVPLHMMPAASSSSEDEENNDESA